MPQTSRFGTVFIWLIVVASILAALPNLLPRSVLDRVPDWLPHRQVSLGLDLSGGSRIVLAIDRAEITRQRLQAAVDAVAARLRSANIAFANLSGSGDRLTLTLRDPSQREAAGQALAPLAGAADRGGDGAGRELVLADGEGGTLTVTLTRDGIDSRLAEAAAASIEVLDRRLTELGVANPRISRQGGNRIVVQVPGLYDPEQLKTVLGQAGDVSYRIIDTSIPSSQLIGAQPPAGSEVLYSAEDPPVAVLVRRVPIVSSHDVVNAEAVDDELSGTPAVDLTFTPDAARRFAEATRSAVGSQLALVLDNAVIGLQPVTAPVTDGRMRLMAEMTPEGAQDLALVLRAGALPAQLTVAEERTSGVGRGQDAIRAMVIAGGVSTIVIVAFMIAFYGSFGTIASIAVVVNVIMMIAVLSLSGLPLTLPGIAGIVLTIGMAVDSNVLVYERVREEGQAGRTVYDAVRSGFSRAFGAIVDANITTLIAAIILLYLGSGAIRGFAVTLAIGIVTTLFTSFTLTRVMLDAWLRKRARSRLPRSIRTGLFDTLGIRFMAVRNIVFAVTAVLSLGSMLAFGMIGMNLGIDFSGGSVLELRAREGNADLADIRSRLGELNLGTVSADRGQTARDAVVRVQSRQGGENAEQTAVLLIRGELEDAYEFRRVEVVGPTISAALARAATLGIAVSLLSILVYLWVRFEWQFAAGAIIATLHDVLIVIGLFVLTGLEFNLASVAALLTVVGYSLNDTVIIYDRIRENLKKFPRMPLPILLDTSINQTLSRTILTGATTILSLAALAAFGSDVIRPFATVLMFGIAVATFSSIYVAGPILILFRLRRPDRVAVPLKDTA